MAAFEGMRAAVEPMETVLHGPVQDQAALYELRRLPEPPGEPEIIRSG
jgi:hypothetical protein